MNWYKKAVRKYAQYGEYWITQDGQTIYADGDVGDYNHEAIVIEHAQSQLVDAMQGDPLLGELASLVFGDTGDYDGFDPVASREILNNWLDDVSRSGMISEEEEDDIYGAIANRTGIDETIVNIAFDAAQNDARRYAIQNWGWKRVAGTNVETWTLTPKDMDVIADGLYDAYDESVETMNFTIYVYSTNQTKDMNYTELASQMQPQQGGLSNTQQQAYDNALDQVDRPSSSFYKGWGD